MALSRHANINEHSNSWEELVAPAPMGIATMSQLLVSASRASDFEINKIDKEHINLMKHPESFRKTLVQIADDAYSAFTKAHENMDLIHLQMEQVPGNVRESIEILKSGNKMAINNELPKLLEKIKNAADNGLKSSTEVSEAFNQLGKLNQQVLLAIVASHGAKEREIENVNKIVCGFVKSGIQVGKNHRLEANEREQANLEKQMKDAKENVQRKQQLLQEAQQFGVGDYFGLLILNIPYSMRVSNARSELNEAEKQLQQIQQESERVGEEKDNIYVKFTTSLKKMHVNVDKELSQNEMFQLLKEGISQLSKLNSNWAGFTQNFNSINNYIEQVAQTLLTDFVEDAKHAKEDTSIVDFIIDSIEKSLKSSCITHHNAKMYVQFSNENIMKYLDDMLQYKNDALLTV